MDVRGRIWLVMGVAAATLSMFGAQAALGQLPKLPAVPQVPALQPPAKVLPAPVTLPQAPVPLPEVRTPAPRLPVQPPPVRVPGVTAPAPRTPAAPQVQAPQTPADGPAPGAGGAGAASREQAAARTGQGRAAPAAGGLRRARTRRPAGAPRSTRAERRLRAAVSGLWACSYAVSRVQRRVLQHRVGLDGKTPASLAGTAKALGLSVRVVRRAQRAGLRALRRANHRDGCAMGTGERVAAREERALVAVATAPVLRPMSYLRGLRRASEQPGARPDQGQVLGQRSAGRNFSPARPRLVAAGTGSQGPSPWPVLAPLMVLAAAAALVMLGRGRLPQAASPGPPTPPAPPGPVPPPAPAALQDDRPPPQAHQPPPAPWHGQPAEPAGQFALEEPEEPAAQPHTARRAAGLAASGVASVAIGLLLRARRRR